MSCRSQLQELKAAKTLISCQHFGVIYSPLMASGARRQWAGERWKLSLPPSTLFHLHLRCQSVSITLGGMRSSERSADPLPAPLPEPEGSLIALLMSLLLQIDSCASAKFIHSTPSSIKINIMTTSRFKMYIFHFWCFIISVLLWKQWKISCNHSLQQQEVRALSLFVLKTVLLNIYCESELPTGLYYTAWSFFFPLTQIVWLEAAIYPLPTPAPHPGFSGPLAQGALGHGLAGLLIFGWGEVHAGWWGMCTFGLRAWDSAALGQNKCPRRTSVCHSASLCDRNGTAKA